jgi:alanine racemase
LRIDLGALAGNYRTLKQHAYADVGAVVKANGYGLGAAAIAERLWGEQCRTFFVATAEEGALLRQVQTAAEIFVLEGALPDTCDELVQNTLTPVLNTSDQCRLWAATGAAAGLHVDTGMQRLGLGLDELGGVLHGMSLPISLLVSHFARADEPGHAFTQLQLERARDAYQGVSTLYPNVRLSLTNSAGVLQGIGPEHLGRAGIALYGGNPYSTEANPMQAVATLEAQVLQVRRVEAGTPIGYGGSFETRRESRIATVGVGYADGVPRLLSGRGRVYSDGRYFPMVGRVSMDMLHVDVTDGAVDEGAWVEVFGTHIGVDEVAQHAQTIAYEVLTGLGDRPTRRYLGQSR